MAVISDIVRRARAEAGQLSWWLRDHRDPARRRNNRIVRAGMQLPALPRRRRVKGSIWAVTMVKDEVDIIALTIAHLFSQGVDEVLVADNGSTDGTLEALRELAAAEPRLHIALDREPAYHQSEKMTLLAKAATRAGADWVIPFDADEFWFARNCSVGEYFRSLDARCIGMVRAAFHNAIPTEDASDLLHADYVMDSSPLLPWKVAHNAHPLAVISVGNHGTARTGETVGGLYIAHVAYRGPAHVARKVRQGAAAVDLTRPTGDIARHWRTASGLSDEEIADAWRRISSGQSDGRLRFVACGPMVLVRPLLWATWDPDGLVPAAEPHEP